MPCSWITSKKCRQTRVAFKSSPRATNILACISTRTTLWPAGNGLQARPTSSLPEISVSHLIHIKLVSLNQNYLNLQISGTARVTPSISCRLENLKSLCPQIQTEAVPSNTCQKWRYVECPDFIESRKSKFYFYPPTGCCAKTKRRAAWPSLTMGRVCGATTQARLSHVQTDCLQSPYWKGIFTVTTISKIHNYCNILAISITIQ